MIRGTPRLHSGASALQYLHVPTGSDNRKKQNVLLQLCRWHTTLNSYITRGLFFLIYYLFLEARKNYLKHLSSVNSVVNRFSLKSQPHSWNQFIVLLLQSSLRARTWIMSLQLSDIYTGFLSIWEFVSEYYCWFIKHWMIEGQKYIFDLLLTYEPFRPLRSSGIGLLSVPELKPNTENSIQFYVSHIWSKLPETASLLHLSVPLNQG